MILDNIFQKRSLSKPSDALLAALTGSEKTVSGVTVNETTALQISAVWACVRVISETVSSLPLFIFRRTGDGREVATNHPLYDLLHNTPSPDMSSMIFREAIMIHVLTWGNGYARIRRTNRGEPWALEIVLPNIVEVNRDQRTNEIYYNIMFDANRQKIERVESADMLHVAGPTHEGLVGMSPVTMARESMGITKASEQYGAAIFGNNSRPSGVLEHPGKMNKEAHERLKSSWEKAYKGSENAGKTAVLEEGMKFNAISFPPEDAQMLETRQFQVEEIARWYNVPPHKIQHLLRATFSNIDSQQISFATDTIRPWLVRYEMEMNRKLFAGDPEHFAEFSIDALLRGDPKLRADSLAVQFQHGALTIDEWRALENRNALDGDIGTKHYVMANLVAVEDGPPGKEVQPPPPDENIGDDKDDDEEEEEKKSLVRQREVLNSHRQMIRDVLRRCLAVESDRVEKSRRQRNTDEFAEWVGEFYVRHVDHVRGALAPAINAAIDSTRASWPKLNEYEAAELDGEVCQVTKDIADRHVAESVSQLNGSGVSGAVEYWRNGRADDEAGRAMFDLVGLVQK